MPSTSPLRILFATSRSFFPLHFSGGAIRLVHRLLLELSRAHGIECRALAALRRGTPFRRFPPRAAWAALGIRTARRRTQAWEFDCGYPIRFCDGPVDASYRRSLASFRPHVVLSLLVDRAQPLLAEARARGIGVLLYLMNGDLDEPPSGELPALDQLGVRFVALSSFIRSELRRVHGLRASLVYPPFEPNEFRTPGGSAAGGCLTMINPHPAKGVDTFLRIAAKLPNERFLLVEGWPLRPPLKQALHRELARLSNVELVGRVVDMRAIYRRTRLLLVPSLWKEGFGCVALEAQASGIPVVASRIGGLPEAVGRGGVLVGEFDEPAAWVKTIRSLLDDGAAMRRLGRAAARNAERTDFSLATSVGSFLEIARRAAAGRVDEGP